MAAPEPITLPIRTADEGAAHLIHNLSVAATQTRPVSVDLPTAVVLPEAAKVHVLDPQQFDGLRDAPRRARGTVEPATIEAFIDYVREHRTEATTIWVAPETGKVVAVINDHGPGADPGWGDHRAVFTPRITAEWRRWAGADGKFMGQEQFAELLEDGLAEIAIPDGGQLLEIASTMTGHTNVTWQSAVRLSNGAVKAQYVEETSAKAGQKNDLEIPTAFTLVMPVFYGGDNVQVDARLRWRLKGGELLLGFRLDNPHRAVDDAIRAMDTKLGSEFSRVYTGTPR